MRDEISALGTGIGLALLGVFVAISLLTWDIRDPQILPNFEAPSKVIHNSTGIVGALTSSFLYRAHGVASFFMPIAMIALAIMFVKNRSLENGLRITAGIMTVLIGISMLVELIPNGLLAENMANRSIDGPGGVFGAVPIGFMHRIIGGVGTGLVVIFALSAGTLLISRTWVEKTLAALGNGSMQFFKFMYASTCKLATSRTTETSFENTEVKAREISGVFDIENMLSGNAANSAPEQSLFNSPAPDAAMDSTTEGVADDDVMDFFDSFDDTSTNTNEQIEDTAAETVVAVKSENTSFLQPPEDEFNTEYSNEYEEEDASCKDNLNAVDSDASETVVVKREIVATQKIIEPEDGLVDTTLVSREEVEEAESRLTTQLNAQPAAPINATQTPEDEARWQQEIAMARASKPTKDVRYNPRNNTKNDYCLPNAKMLIDDDVKCEIDDTELTMRGKKIIETLDTYKIKASLINYLAGPGHTTYEIEVAKGTRVNSVCSMEADLAMAVMSNSVRIAPIPQRSTIGIEVANSRTEIVRMRPLISNLSAQKAEGGVPLLLGREAGGKPLVEDLAKMPHLLVAGTTGSGKSICLNSIIMSVVMLKRPDEVQMILIDPKMVEFSRYSGIPHLTVPIVTESRHAAACFDWVVQEMGARYKMLQQTRTRDISQYNKLPPEERMKRANEMHHKEPEKFAKKLPYLLLMVDEFSDLMATSAKEVEVAITRIAQKARAAGIHMVLATQRPSVDVVTSVIKANLPARIAFRVDSRVNSSVVIDKKGAEKLLGNGDMLYKPATRSDLIRAKGVYLEDDEIEGILDFTRSQNHREVEMALANRPNIADEMDLFSFPTIVGKTKSSSINVPAERDEIYEAAVLQVLEEKRASASFLQSVLNIGYPKAARYVTRMENEGLVGPHNGSKQREILMNIDQYIEAMEARSAVKKSA